MSIAVRLTLLTAFLTACLAVLKLTAGHYGHSHVLFADGIHSVADIIVDILILFAAHYGSQKADHNHPYGHGRIETAATVGLALIVFMAGLGIIGDGIKYFWENLPAPPPNHYVLWTAIIAVILNEGLFRYALKISAKIDSPLLEANAWHSRSDAAVSGAVLLSVGGSLFGFPHIDIIGAVFVGSMICKMGSALAWKSLSELVDTGADKKILAQIKHMIHSVSGVRELHLLRTRTLNKKIFIDVHILVSPYISVSEGHFIGDQVIQALHAALPEIADITVHVDPENDEMNPLSINLLSREKIILLLKNAFADVHLPLSLSFPKDIRLHYLNGQTDIELLISENQKKYLEKYYIVIDTLLKNKAIHYIHTISIVLVIF